MQRYHLLICDPAPAAILATKTPGGLLLPMLSSSWRRRPALLINRMLRQLGVRGSLVCIRAAEYDERLDEVNWTCVIDGRSARDSRTNLLNWIPVDAAARQRWLLPYQAGVLTRPQPPSDSPTTFEEIGWLDRVSGWLSETLPSAHERVCNDPLIFRASPTRAVVQ